MTLTGIDLSHFNTTPDLTPYDFVFQKCTQGTGYLDPTYHERKQLVISAGKVFGAYHFMTTNVSVIDQVSWFVENANIGPGDIVIADFEDDGHWSQFTNEQLALKGIALLMDLDRNYPDNRHVLYCNQNTYNNIVHPFGVLGNDALWIADPSGTPSFPYTFWQYSSNGIDLDRTSTAFNTLQDLENWANMTNPLTQPIARQGFKEDGTPQTGNTDLQTIIAYFDNNLSYLAGKIDAVAAKVDTLSTIKVNGTITGTVTNG